MVVLLELHAVPGDRLVNAPGGAVEAREGAERLPEVGPAAGAGLMYVIRRRS